MSNGTNYVYLDESTGLPAVSSSSFVSGQFPVAIVVANGGNITSIIDVRTFVVMAGSWDTPALLVADVLPGGIPTTNGSVTGSIMGHFYKLRIR